MRSVPLKFNVKLAALLLLGHLLAVALLPATASAYVEEGYHWPFGQPIVMNLQLEATAYTFTDGSTSWDQVAEAAMSIWNADLGSGVEFQPSFTALTPAQDDGINSVLFSYSAFGEDFGADTLAVTIYYGNASSSLFTEADVIFNQNYSFNSYRGPLEMNGAFVSTYDLRRVALHEFGHVLGLGHVAQGSASIMTPSITNIDTIQADDIAGVEAIYGPPSPPVPFISSPLVVNTTLNAPFSYQITALNFPSSFSASGLPVGLSLDAGTGEVSGTPTEAGTYQVVLTATGGSGTGAATLILSVTAAPSITSPLTATAYIGKPFHYQIKATSAPTQYSAVPPLTNISSLPLGLSLDANTGVISGTPTRSGPYTVTLTVTNAVASGTAKLQIDIANDNTLEILNNDGASSLVRGSDGNIYGTTGGGTYNEGIIFRLNADDTQTTVFDFSAPGPNEPSSVQQAADGTFSGLTARGGTNDLGAIYHVGADSNLVTIYSFASDEYTDSRSISVVQGSDGNYYGTISYSVFYMITEAAGLVFKVTPAGVMTTLHQFNGSDGFYPTALIEGTDGSFYGTTNEGGSGNNGTAFKITPDGTFTTLHEFGSVAGEGVQPAAPLMQAADGNFYGTTYQGGAEYDGTVFKMTPDGVLTTLHVFTNAEGKNPMSALAQGTDGNFYGTSGINGPVGPGVFAGTLFKVTPDGALTNLHVFASFDGQAPFLALVPDQNGNFYGAARGLGTPVLFKEMPDGVTTSPVHPSVNTPTVTLEATTPEVTAGSGETGLFTLNLSAMQTTDVIVTFAIKGTAVNGTDYESLKTTKKIKAGALSKLVRVAPLGNLGGVSKKTVTLTLQPGDGYTVGTIEKAKVTILAAP